MENFLFSVNTLIHLGHSNAWDYDYYFYKKACEHAKRFEKMQVIAQASAISLVFSGKKAIKDFLKDDEKVEE